MIDEELPGLTTKASSGKEREKERETARQQD
jgi:hypothetical protein